MSIASGKRTISGWPARAVVLVTCLQAVLLLAFWSHFVLAGPIRSSLGEAADFLATFVAPFAFVALSALGFVSIRQRPAPEDGPLDGTAGVVAALGLVTGIWCGLFLILLLMPIAD